MKVLITGISGALARILAKRLLARGHEVIGLDRRPWPDPPKGIEVYQADIRKRPAESVFRKHRPDAMVHLATVTHLSVRFEERYRINLNGTRAIFENCARYGVKQAIFAGRHTIYGAAPDSPLYHTEGEPPMAASTFPDLSDLVAADLYAGSALWRWPEIATSVLRLVYTIGPSRRGTLSAFLSGRRVPMVLGFDPLFHFMHEQDAAEAIAAALEHAPRGVFNVAGPQPVPLSVLAKAATGKRGIPFLEPVFSRILGRFGFPRLPAGAVNHVKYSIVVDDSAFREATGFDHVFDETRTMEAFRWS